MDGDRILRTAIVGLRHDHVGSFGPQSPGYLHTLQHTAGVEIVAFCEGADPARLQEARRHYPAAGIYTNVDDLIEHEDFELAWVVLPAADVPRAGVKLAEAGKHFYMEKQFARTSADLAELVRAVRRHRVKVLPGYPHRFNPVARDLRRLIERGVLGRPLDLEVRLITGQVRSGVRDPSSFLYSREAEGGGVLHMLGGHYIDVMRFLMGDEVKAVQAMMGRPVGHIEEPLEDVITAALEFHNGAMGTIHAGYLQSTTRPYDSGMVFRGLDGEATWTPIGSPRLEVSSSSAEWSDAPDRTFKYALAPSPPGYTRGGLWMFNWIQDFIRGVQIGTEPQLTVEDALRVLQVIDACYASARTGQRVEVPETCRREHQERLEPAADPEQEAAALRAQWLASMATWPRASPSARSRMMAPSSRSRRCNSGMPSSRAPASACAASAAAVPAA